MFFFPRIDRANFDESFNVAQRASQPGGNLLGITADAIGQSRSCDQILKSPFDTLLSARP